MSDLLLTILLGITVAPLLLVAILAIATRFNLPIADRVLDLTVRLLTIQWFVGAHVNIVVGVAMTGLGMWFAWPLSPSWRWAAAALLIAFGMWRTLRGVAVLRSARDGT